MTLTEKKLDKALNNSIKDGVAYSAMDGIASTYATPFALALGANNAEVGLLNSIPNLFVTLSQPLIGKYIDKIGKKDVCESLNFMQRLLWIPIIFIPMLFLKEGIFLFILLLTLQTVILSFANTAWSSWMGNLVPEKIRGSYFGKRSTIQSAFSFATTLLAGWVLGFTNNLLGFSMVFLLAFIFGLVSYFYLTKIPDDRSDTKNHEGHKRGLSTLEFIKDFKKYRNFYPFTIHMSLLNFAVNIASPFFTVYMLSVMKIGYQWYAIVIAVEILARILFQSYWGKLSDRFGDRTILILCNILIVFYPFFWLFVTNPLQLILISIFSGIGWSGLDLSTFNYLLDVTPPEKRHAYISKYKMFTGFALFAGALLGGFLAQYLSNATFLFLGGLQLIFFTSFALRGASAIYGAARIEETRIKASEILPVGDVFLKAFAVYPARGITHEIFYVEHCFECWGKGIKRRFKNLKYAAYRKV